MKHNYTGSQIFPCVENFIILETIKKEKEVSLREAAGCSIAGNQGYQRCHCRMGCKNNKCACRAAKIM